MGNRIVTLVSVTGTVLLWITFQVVIHMHYTQFMIMSVQNVPWIWFWGQNNLNQFFLISSTDFYLAFLPRQKSQNVFGHLNFLLVIVFHLFSWADLEGTCGLFWSVNILIIYFFLLNWTPWGKSSRKGLFVHSRSTNLQMTCFAIWNVCVVLKVNSSFVLATIQESSASPLPGLHLVSEGQEGKQTLGSYDPCYHLSV